MMKSDSIAVSFRELELNCEMNFKKNPSYWHLFTDGRNSEIIFRDQSEMITGMNILAISCVHYSDVKVFTFELMNNHLHMILAGAKDRCEALFYMFKARLWRCFMRNGRTVDLRRFNCELIEILSLQSLRNEMAMLHIRTALRFHIRGVPEHAFLIHSFHRFHLCLILNSPSVRRERYVIAIMSPLNRLRSKCTKESSCRHVIVIFVRQNHFIEMPTIIFSICHAALRHMVK